MQYERNLTALANNPAIHLNNVKLVHHVENMFPNRMPLLHTGVEDILQGVVVELIGRESKHLLQGIHNLPGSCHFLVTLGQDFR